MQQEPDQALDALWERVLEAFDDEARHAAFLEYCQRADRLLDAATRYRQASSDSAHAAAAQTHLKRVAAIAMSKLERPASADARRTGRVRSSAVLALVAMAIIGLLAYLASGR